MIKKVTWVFFYRIQPDVDLGASVKFSLDLSITQNKDQGIAVQIYNFVLNAD